MYGFCLFFGVFLFLFFYFVVVVVTVFRYFSFFFYSVLFVCICVVVFVDVCGRRGELNYSKHNVKEAKIIELLTKNHIIFFILFSGRSSSFNLLLF